MVKQYFIKVPNIAAALLDQNRLHPAHKNSDFRSCVAVHKPISTKLGTWIEDVRTFFAVDNCFGIRLLVLG